jgi:hypothetical protein
MKRSDLADAMKLADVFATQARQCLDEQTVDRSSGDLCTPLRNTRNVTDVRKLSMRMSKLMLALRKPESKEGA